MWITLVLLATPPEPRPMTTDSAQPWAYFLPATDLPAVTERLAGRVYRKLYHTRYAVETTDHDFLTYFEFDREHTPAFTELLAKLRDPATNPEWKFVDREYEVWLTKTGAGR